MRIVNGTAPLALCEDPEQLDEINLDYAATTPALQAAVDAVVAFLPWYGSVHRGGGRRSEVSTEAYEQARASAARFIDCPSDSTVVFVRNTTEAANVLSSALPRYSRVLCSPIEHHANLLPWRGHEVDHLPFTSSLGAFLEATEAALARAATNGRPYRLLAVTGASNVTGEVTPLEELSRIAHAHGALIFVDAAQLAPHRPISLARTGVDFLAFSGHKVYAPFGTGVLALRDEALPPGTPLLKGGGAVRMVTLDHVAWADPPRRYEAGTPNLVGAVALGAACDALADYGMQRIAENERRLSAHLWSGLASTPGVELLRLWPDAPDRVGVATFTVRGCTAAEVGDHLSSRHRIAVRTGSFCAHPLVAHLLDIDRAHTDDLLARIDRGEDVDIPGAVRASVGLGSTVADVDGLLAGLGELLDATEAYNRWHGSARLERALPHATARLDG
jgi:selenocysteine lyase/cysteine desulfurase